MPVITVRSIGKKKPIVPDWEWPNFPEESGGEGEDLTLREIITRIVLEEVKAYRQRQSKRRLVGPLTAKEIERGRESGKIDMGGHDLNQEVDDDEAVAVALTAFIDGLYIVMIDGEEQNDLDKTIFITPDSHIVFIRLIMLAGGF